MYALRWRVSYRTRTTDRVKPPVKRYSSERNGVFLGVLFRTISKNSNAINLPCVPLPHQYKQCLKTDSLILLSKGSWPVYAGSTLAPATTLCKMPRTRYRLIPLSPFILCISLQSVITSKITDPCLGAISNAQKRCRAITATGLRLLGQHND
jgi:hypothetical protein